MRSILVLVGLLAAAAAPGAHAAWSPLAALPGSSRSGGALGPLAALDARGDAAVAWAPETQGTSPSVVSLRVAVRRGAGGRFVTTLLLRPGHRALGGDAIVVDPRGETTVAWVERATKNGLGHGPISLRAAYRSPSGRWSAIRTLAHISPFRYAFPRLAVAPDGRVVLTFNAGNKAAPGVAAVWRRPGHGFGAVQDLRTGSRGAGYLYDVATRFDAAGRAYVGGIRGCDTPASTGLLLIGAPGASRFAAARITTPAPAAHLRLAVPGVDRVVLTWFRTSCSTTEEGGGPILSTTVRGGQAAAPATVDAAGGLAHGLAAGPGGTAEAWWAGYSASAPSTFVSAARSDAAGAFGAPFAPPGDLVPVIADGRGDQLVGFADANWLSVGGQPTDLRARTPDGALISPPVATGKAGGPAAVTPTGVGLGLVVYDRGRLWFTRWTP